MEKINSEKPLTHANAPISAWTNTRKQAAKLQRPHLGRVHDAGHRLLVAATTYADLEKMDRVMCTRRYVCAPTRRRRSREAYRRCWFRPAIKTTRTSRQRSADISYVSLNMTPSRDERSEKQHDTARTDARDGGFRANTRNNRFGTARLSSRFLRPSSLGADVDQTPRTK